MTFNIFVWGEFCQSNSGSFDFLGCCSFWLVLTNAGLGTGLGQCGFPFSRWFYFLLINKLGPFFAMAFTCFE